MELYELIIDAVASLFLIYIFGFVLLPAFAQATGQNTILFTILFIILAISIVAAVVIAILKRA
ncbi:MAG: hypothetical protein ABSB80_09310 [Methanoregula sp.]|jgi:hypothetical protein|uniref:hypothetical protein n=1 Tax=Methanoregula sp. TaxID=2052170 RepID=UPI003D0A7A38